MHPEIFELDQDLKPAARVRRAANTSRRRGQRWGNRSTSEGCSIRMASTGGWRASGGRWRLRHDSPGPLPRLEAYWSIPAEEETAVNGVWVKAPGQALFNRLREVFGDLPFVAEDLGLITPEVDELREHFRMPACASCSSDSGPRRHLHSSAALCADTVVYTGTHDNNTTLGWWRVTRVKSAQESANVSAAHLSMTARSSGR